MRIVQEALTFDDVLLVPAYSEVLPREVDLSTRLTRGIRLNLPFVSAAMDTVTEARLAITIAQDRESSVVHGMPGVAIELGGATHVLPADKIADALVALVNH